MWTQNRLVEISTTAPPTRWERLAQQSETPESRHRRGVETTALGTNPSRRIDFSDSDGKRKTEPSRQEEAGTILRDRAIADTREKRASGGRRKKISKGSSGARKNEDHKRGRRIISSTVEYGDVITDDKGNPIMIRTSDKTWDNNDAKPVNEKECPKN